MVTPVPPNAAHADQVPTIGTAVETERERLVELGVRRRGVELECAGSRAEWGTSGSRSSDAGRQADNHHQDAESLWQRLQSRRL
jgi:hypothetical protein